MGLPLTQIAWFQTVGMVVACAIALEGIALVGGCMEWLF